VILPIAGYPAMLPSGAVAAPYATAQRHFLSPIEWRSEWRMAKEEGDQRGADWTANDNGDSRSRIDGAILRVARALGRQIARERFAERERVAANDNRPSPRRDEEE